MGIQQGIASVLLTIFLGGCMLSNPKSITPPSVTALSPTRTPFPSKTPTACSGWNCSLEGFIYVDEASFGNELAGVIVHLQQISWCSPTRGEYETITGTDGTFRFEVYLHDTDTFWIEVDVEGYLPVRQAMGGLDCLNCACPPIEIILQPKDRAACGIRKEYERCLPNDY